MPKILPNGARDWTEEMPQWKKRMNFILRHEQK